MSTESSMDKFASFVLRTMFNQKEDEYKLSGFWYSIFRPVHNRYYVGMKLYTIAFVLRYIPIGIFLVVSAIVYNNLGLAVLLLVLVVVALVDFFIIRKYEEKVTWKYLYSSHYADKDFHKLDRLMKKVEQDPSPENQAELETKLER